MVYRQYVNRFERSEERIEEMGDAFVELDVDDDFQSSY